MYPVTMYISIFMATGNTFFFFLRKNNYVWNIIFSSVARFIILNILILLYNEDHELGFLGFTSVFTTGPSNPPKDNNFGKHVPKTNQNKPKCHFTILKHSELWVMVLP